MIRPPQTTVGNQRRVKGNANAAKDDDAWVRAAVRPMSQGPTRLRFLFVGNGGDGITEAKMRAG
jgi:hypothetical protein